MAMVNKRDLEACKAHREAVARMDESIARLRCEVKRMARAQSMAPSQEGAGDGRGDQIGRLMDMEAERACRAADMEAHIRTVEGWIAELTVPQATVLRLRYVEGLPWEDVAERAHYSRRHCTKIHEEAIKQAPKRPSNPC